MGNVTPNYPNMTLEKPVIEPQYPALSAPQAPISNDTKAIIAAIKVLTAAQAETKKILLALLGRNY